MADIVSIKENEYLKKNRIRIFRAKDPDQIPPQKSIFRSRPWYSDMDGFQNGGYIWAQGVLQYHLIEVSWLYPKKCIQATFLT